MRPARAATLLLLPLLLAPSVFTQERGAVFDKVVSTLQRRFHDREFRKQQIPLLAKKFRPAAEATESLQEEREVIHEFLSRIPASHLAIYSEATHESLIADLMNRKRPMFGFGLVELGDQYFVRGILEGGPAERAGLLNGDRILEIDGVPTAESPRLDWRSDDAWLPDPPVHSVLTEEPGERIRLVVERRLGHQLSLQVHSKDFSIWQAAENSVRIVEHDGLRFGYVHFWLVHMSGPGRLIERLAEDEFADCDGLLLDLRGRGGSAAEVNVMISKFKGRRAAWKKPMVALLDRGSRSAKEVLAYRIRDEELGVIVGERTAGAVIPATFAPMGQDTWLMYPSFDLGKYTDLLEGKGVEPHVHVEWELPYSEGADAIFETGVRTLGKLCRGASLRDIMVR